MWPKATRKIVVVMSPDWRTHVAKPLEISSERAILGIAKLVLDPDSALKNENRPRTRMTFMGFCSFTICPPKPIV